MTCKRPGFIAAAVVAATAFAVLGPAVAQGQDRPQDQSEDRREAARRSLEEGSRHYRDGNYEAAARSFEAARVSYPSPKIHFNLGQTYRRLNRPAATVDAFEAFLAEAPDAAPEMRRDAEDQIRVLRQQVASIRVIDAAPGAEIRVDGTRIGFAPLRRPIVVMPGRHELTASRGDGAVLSRAFDLNGGDVVEWLPSFPLAGAAAPAIATAPAVAPTSSAQPAASVEAGAASERPNRWWLWAVLGGVVLAAGVSALLITRDAPLPTGTLGAYDGRMNR
jgi:tetratricopeptide (TPR) repeat protein